MSKRALLLTAAVAALLIRPVLADDFTDITDKVTQQIKTSTAADGSPGDILIESTGSVVVTVAGPAVEIDSPNAVTNQGLISNIGTDSAIGVQLDATAAGNGPGADVNALDNAGTIDLSGDGSTKTAVLVGIANGDATGIFNGGILFEAGSQLTLTGDNSIGIHVAENTTMNGNIDLAGNFDLTGTGETKTGILIGTGEGETAILNGNLTLELASVLNVTGNGSAGIHIAQDSSLTGDLTLNGSISMNPTTANSTDPSNLTAVLVDTNANGNAIGGNVTIGTGAKVSAEGQGAQGMVLLGGIGGSLTNDGNIGAIGTGTPSSTATNPEGGSALVIGGSIAGGILNAGKLNQSDTTATANISVAGIAPAIVISPSGSSTSGIEIGVYDDPTNPGFSFLNRGTISAQAIDTNNGGVALEIEGVSDTIRTIFDGGIFNSGSIKALGSTDTKAGTPAIVNTIFIGDFAEVPTLVNSTQAGGGSITAIVGGDREGEAAAIQISKMGSLQSIVNEGTISATAFVNDPTDPTIQNLAARAIWDRSGTLTSIVNSGTISAIATTLDDDDQLAIAADLGAAQQGVTFDNSGIVNGEILFGAHDDTLTVHGVSGTPAVVGGNIYFGGGIDNLDVANFATVDGIVEEAVGGHANVTVETGGTLTLNNDGLTLLDSHASPGLAAGTLDIQDGGTLNLSIAQPFNVNAPETFVGPVIEANNLATLERGALLNVSFKSFITSLTGTSQFILIDTPLDQLNIADFSDIETQIVGPGKVPFLFLGSLCTVNVGNGDPCSETSETDSELVLNLTPKTPQKDSDDLTLTGYALTMFPLANRALANDPQLGAAVINGVTDNKTAQAAYSAFAPNVTGASRALAIALTDQASGPVAARQRSLRMYAAQPGDTTLWGQEFGVSLNQDANTNTIGYRDSGFGFALGMDAGDPADGRYGGALTFYSGDIGEKNPLNNKTSSEWGILTGYTDWRGRGFFFDSQLNVGVGQLDGKRLLKIGGISRVAEGKRPTLLGGLGATTGVILTSGSTVFTPLLSVDGLAMREDGYTEHGGGGPDGDGFDLNVKSTYYQSLRAFLGLDVRQDIDVGDFYLQPEARAGYRYDFLSNPEKFKGSFVSTPNTNFTLTGPDPTQGNAVFGASLAATTGAWSLGVHFDYLRGNDGSVSQEGTVGLVGRL